MAADTVYEGGVRVNHGASENMSRIISAYSDFSLFLQGDKNTETLGTCIIR